MAGSSLMCSPFTSIGNGINNEYFEIISFNYLGLENWRQSYLSLSLIIVPLLIGHLSTSPTENSPLPSDTQECA